MLKNMKKSTKSNVITLGIVVGFYVLIQILSACIGMMTSLAADSAFVSRSPTEGEQSMMQ